MNKKILLMSVMLGFGWHALFSAGDSAHEVVPFTQDAPRWWQELDKERQERSRKRFFDQNQSSLFLPGMRRFIPELFYLKNFVPALESKNSSLYSDSTQDRLLYLFNQDDVDLSNVPLSKPSAIFTNEKFITNYPPTYFQGSLTLDKVELLEKEYLEAVQTRNRRLWLPIFQGMKKHRFDKDHGLSYVTVIKQVGLEGLECVLRKEADVEELAAYTKMRISCFLDNRWYAVSHKCDRYIYGLSYNTVGIINALVKVMVDNPDIPQVVDLESALSFLGLESRVNEVLKAISIDKIDIVDAKRCRQDFITIAVFAGIGLISRDEAQDYYKKLRIACYNLSDAQKTSTLKSISNRNLEGDDIFPWYELYCLHNELDLGGAPLYCNDELMKNARILMTDIFNGRFSKKKSARN